ncbi:MAG: class I SAM-dependent methyltransferase [bacterium]
MGSNKKYFDDCYKWSLEPVKDITFSLYSANTWETFRKYICDDKAIIDLGCGAGVLLYNIHKVASRFINCNVVGYDFAEESISLARQLCPGVIFKTGGILNTEFKSNTFDIIASTMAIEHVDDEMFIKEIARIIKPNGILLLTTVMKKKWAWYYLKNKNGKRVLELTHLREYANPQELISKLRKYGFKTVFLETPAIKFSILDFVLIRLAKIFKKRLFLEIAAKDIIVKLRKIFKVTVPGYFAIEIIATRI